MTRGFSRWLDACRLLAALAVLLSHWAYPRFTGGDYIALRVFNIGSDAVVAFFVLSGLVIAYTAREKDRDLRSFGFARVTRIWSVCIPALLLTLLLDAIGSRLWPADYAGWWYAPLSGGDTLRAGLLMAGEWTGGGVRLGTNGPWWSLSYEVAYYALFAVAFYVKGWRRVALLAAGAVLIGPRVLVLMPAWLLGVALLHVLPRAEALPRTSALALAILPPMAYLTLQVAGLPGWLLEQTTAALGADMVAALRFSNEFAWNWLLALLFAAHLAGMAALMKARKATSRGATFARWAAGASFSLYVTHYPVMQFLDAALPETIAARQLVLLAGPILVALLFAEAFERTLPQLRRAVAQLPRRRAAA